MIALPVGDDRDPIGADDERSHIGAGNAQARRNHEAAVALARKLERIVRRLQRKGMGTREIAAELNRRAVPTPQGARWHSNSVYRLIRRLDEIKWAADDVSGDTT